MSFRSLARIPNFARVAPGKANYHSGHHRAPTLNDLPVPEGDWFVAQKKKNAKYNTVLAVGVTVLGASIVALKANVHFNFSPPKSLD